MQQLFFKFPVKLDYLSEDFIVSSANSQAFKYLNQWPNWNSGIYSKFMLLYGEAGSGKTHLAHIWQRLSNAQFISNEDPLNFSSLSESAYILENIETIKEQNMLFHLINYLVENQKYLLLTSGTMPNNLNFSLADLQSRIMAIPSLAINQPDDELLQAVLLKHLSDRQLTVQAGVLDYITSRIERSFCKLYHVVEQLDLHCKVTKKRITIPEIKKILSQ